METNNQLLNFVPQFIETSYAGIENRGMHKAAKDVQMTMKIARNKWNDYYILKMDVTKYFFYIDKRILFNLYIILKSLSSKSE